MAKAFIAYLEQDARNEHCCEKKTTSFFSELWKSGRKIILPFANIPLFTALKTSATKDL